jgi:S1-C subfamily serine protease
VELPALQRSGNAGCSGLVIVAPQQEGPADRAGLLVGDVLLAAAGGPLLGAQFLPEALQGGEVSVSSLRVMRGGAVSVVEMPLEISGRVA